MRSIFRRSTKDPAVATLEEAEALEQKGEALAAIELLNEANREHPSAAIEVRLVQMRCRAFGELGAGPSSPPAAEPVEPGSAADDDGMPVVAADELTAARIAGALESHGALIVRGLVGPDRVKLLVDGIDRAFDGRDAAARGASMEQTSPWYAEFAPDGDGAAAVANRPALRGAERLRRPDRGLAKGHV